MDTISHDGRGGTANIVELSRTLIEAALNEIMDAQADEVCEGSGTYFPERMVDRYGRTDKAVVAAVREMYADGVSTRKAGGRRKAGRGQDELPAGQQDMRLHLGNEGLVD